LARLPPVYEGPWSSLVGAVKEWKQMDVSHLVSRLDREAQRRDPHREAL
jgi:hypothetical protein